MNDPQRTGKISISTLGKILWKLKKEGKKTPFFWVVMKFKYNGKMWILTVINGLKVSKSSQLKKINSFKVCNWGSLKNGFSFWLTVHCSGLQLKKVIFNSYIFYFNLSILVQSQILQFLLYIIYYLLDVQHFYFLHLFRQEVSS